MKYVVVGGTGFIGSKVVAKLRSAGHEVIAAAPETGVNSITGDGLEHAMANAHAVLDVTNSPTFDPKGILDFFGVSTSNLIKAEKKANVRHHVLLSIVGTDRLPDNAYFQGKILQEDLVKASGVPFTIVHSTQFMEFLGAIADLGGSHEETRISTGHVQVIAANDLADALSDILLRGPTEEIVEVAGPNREPMSDAVSRYLTAKGDTRRVIADPDALYFGARLETDTLVPKGKARIGKTSFSEWLASTAQ
ncbi:SDR family oxidoreductase [Agrobacterium tumefaciens]|uniref:SDR family oxidoreductase n=1 Tax=Agrobacterium tumefaciens TaxID=358 RepID=UPI003BA2CE04